MPLIVCVCLALAGWRFGAMAPIASAAQTVLSFVERPFTAVIDATTHGVSALVGLPALASERDDLRRRNTALSQEIDDLRERLARAPGESALERVATSHPDGIRADVIGYDPAHTRNEITIDQGSVAGVVTDAGVIDADGAVGRIVATTPFSSRVLLLTDYTSAVPAVVQNGRWWGIVRGTLTRLQLQYVALDAPLHIGDRIVTGRGRSFSAGIPIGSILSIEHSDAALTQSAVIEPVVRLERLEQVVVLRPERQ